MLLSSFEGCGLLGALCEERFEIKMAEKDLEVGYDRCGNVAFVDSQNEANPGKQSSKRCSSTSPGKCPPPKSPRTDVISPTTETPGVAKGQQDTDVQELQTENSDGSTGSSVSPTAHRKSWRRGTMSRRFLHVLPKPYQALCGNISTSLSQHERLMKLMEASMKLVIGRTQNQIQSVPEASLETFQKQVEHIQKEWGFLAKSTRSEPHQQPCSASRSSNPAVEKAMEKYRRAINRLQAEGESWEALLSKHQNKAKELERKVEHSQQTGLSLDPASVAQSSQHFFIESKPDYQTVLYRQQPLLHTVSIIMDTQCKMVRELLSIKTHSQLLVKETSVRLAAEAGFQDLSSDLLRNLMAAPLSSATT
ncbi:kinetochore-associated protein DSN1 homolog isoform X2 [Archocentrus centrarchus]|uniref:kinetochore-associated protein DSN1 homolog isoform X2 n=1 Tax=Archocentrus centrarchus TaxID=63155 RepID=UPI0011EA0BF5|nr:uncharacterized protein LOC115784128 isoform X2 [Archocentrus centrarchus]